MTLNELLEEHPEYGDLDVAIYNIINGDYDFLGDVIDVYTDEQLLIFSQEI